MDTFLESQNQYFAKIGTITTKQEKEIIFY